MPTHDYSALNTAMKSARAALRSARTATFRGSASAKRVEGDLLQLKSRLETALRHADYALGEIRAKISADQIRSSTEKGEQARSGEFVPPPPISRVEELVEHLAHFLARDDSAARFMIREVAGAGGWWARDTGTVAQIEGGKRLLSLSLGGELGIRLIREWPVGSGGGRKRLGAVGLIRLVGGPAAERTARARAAEIRKAYDDGP